MLDQAHVESIYIKMQIITCTFAYRQTIYLDLLIIINSYTILDPHNQIHQVVPSKKDIQFILTVRSSVAAIGHDSKHKT